MKVHDLQFAGYTIEIHTDEDPESPSQWGDDNLFLTGFHRQFHVQRKGFTEKVTKEQSKQFWVFPLYAYIHSGVSLSLGEFSCPWDSGQVGWVYVAKEEWRLQKSARKAAEGLVESWNSYLSGEVYGYIIRDDEGIDLDSCWGFLGDMSYCINEAKSSAESLRRHENEQAAKIDQMMHV